ncbi:MAG TPA: polynucleotide adenylyltransferase PcnB [Gammaproteobacteria bacterium]
MSTERPQADPASPATIIPRPDHNVSRQQISPNALKVLYRLSNAGFQAYLVGGGVRDLLLGREPKDFDVATDALPEEVHDLFRNSRLIGRRFRLVHVRYGQEIIEVSTFRALHGEDDEHPERHLDDSGRILRDNVFGSLAEDAFRRDFTVNALYYNIADFSVVDHVDGVRDLRDGVLRLIGDPDLRFREDPVRMLRAVRFAAKLGFRIEPRTAKVIPDLSDLLRDIPPARLFEEVLKLFLGGYAAQTFEELLRHDLFRQLFPFTEEALAHEENAFPLTFVAKALENTDARVAEGRPVTPFFLFAVLLWEPVRRRAEVLESQGMNPSEAMRVAADEICERQLQYVALPRRFSTPMREVWQLQPRFENRSGKRAQRLLAHPRFRAAYDFLVLRAETGEADPDLAAHWTRLQEGDADEQRALLSQPAPKTGKRRRRGGRRRTSGNPGGE